MTHISMERLRGMQRRIEELEAALKPFADAGRVIPRHWKAKVPLKAQVLPGLIHPHVADYWLAADTLKEIA